MVILIYRPVSFNLSTVLSTSELFRLSETSRYSLLKLLNAVLSALLISTVYCNAPGIISAMAVFGKYI